MPANAQVDIERLQTRLAQALSENADMRRVLRRVQAVGHASGDWSIVLPAVNAVLAEERGRG